MKKLILSSAILAVLGVTSTAMAAPNTGTVNFTGVVTSATCDISLKDKANQDVSNVDFGSVSNANLNATYEFKLVAQSQECLEKSSANVSWSSPTLGSSGIANAAGTGGTNAYLKVQATNATQKGDDSIIKRGQTSFDYNEAKGGIASFDYTATLAGPVKGDLTAGPFNASASYVVAYK